MWENFDRRRVKKKRTCAVATKKKKLITINSFGVKYLLFATVRSKSGVHIPAQEQTVLVTYD